MKSVKNVQKAAAKAAGNLKSAGRNIRQGVKIAKTSGEVIAARTRLAARGDHQELIRMVPEKVAAFSAAGVALARHTTNAALQAGLSAATEWAALQSNATALMRARNPLEVAAIQSNSVMAWWGRRTSQSLAIGQNIMRAQHAMAAPIARTAQANATRLA